MTQVDFYILSDSARNNRFSLTCRLAEKAYASGHRVWIHTDSEQQARQINDMLWTYNDQSFLPHALAEKADKELNPILIACNQDKSDEHDILINLSENTPSYFSQFERVLEPVDKDPQQKEAGRQRYRYYRDCGYPLNMHEISN